MRRTNELGTAEMDQYAGVHVAKYHEGAIRDFPFFTQLLTVFKALWLPAKRHCPIQSKSM
jgi:hypothetical protein